MSQTRLSFADDKGRLALAAIAVLFLALAGRALCNEILVAWGQAPLPIFFDPNDRFADLLKSALSYKFIVSGIVGTAGFANWPPLFQHYLLDNPYDGPEPLHLAITPLGTLMTMLAAKMAVWWEPGLSYLAFFVAYGLASSAIGLWLRSLTSNGASLAIALYVLLLSHPALFMLNRGNFHSGATTLSLVVYSLSVAFRRHRWIGLFCLAAAVNMRPNTAIFATVEILCGKTLRERISGPAAAGVLSLFMWYLFLQTVHSIYPEYSFQSFLGGYHKYVNLYSLGDWGIEWNSSLFGATKAARALLGIQPHYSELIYQLVFGLGVLLYLTIVGVTLRAPIGIARALLLAAAFCALFTPVFAFYHILEFAAPLIVVWSVGNGWTRMEVEDRLVFVVSVVMLCPLAGPLSNGILDATILLGAMAWILGRTAFRAQPVATL